MKKILIVRFSAMGDVAMMVPVVYSLAQQHNDLDITVVSRPFAAPFFDNLAENIRFIGINPKKEYKGIAGIFRLYRYLKAGDFDYVADLHDVLRTKILRFLFLCGGTKTAHINKHRNEKRALVKQKANNYHQLTSSIENYHSVFEELGFRFNLDFSSIYKDAIPSFAPLEDRIKAKHSGERWYGIAPFAAHRSKIYPQEKLRQVIDILLDEDPQCRIFFFGNGEKEHAEISHLINNNTRAMDASKVLGGLKEELILMRHLDAMLTMDSANMHLAALVGTKVVSIWGATHPFAGFLSWKQNPDNIVQKDTECRPCSIYGNKKCIFGDYHCMDIDPHIVTDRLQNQ